MNSNQYGELLLQFSDTGQDKSECYKVDMITFSVQTVDKVKLAGKCTTENCYNFSDDSGQDRTVQSVWRIATSVSSDSGDKLISVVTLVKLKQSGNQYGEFLLQFYNALNKIKLNDCHYGELLFQF